MAILVDANTRVVCQGITGRTATFHCARMQSYGTKLVAGVVPVRVDVITSTCPYSTA